MSRKNFRENALKTIYIHLMRNNMDIDQIISDVEFVSSLTEFIAPLTFDEEMLAVVKNGCKRKEIYALALDQHLKHWRFDRLGYIEQAVLILACSELEFGKQDKIVIVNEAVRIVKIYGQEDSYKLINGVLDAL